MGVATYKKNEKDAIEEVILQSGIKVKPVYTPEDLERVGFDYEKDLETLDDVFEPIRIQNAERNNRNRNDSGNHQIVGACAIRPDLLVDVFSEQRGCSNHEGVAGTHHRCEQGGDKEAQQTRHHLG